MGADFNTVQTEKVTVAEIKSFYHDVYMETLSEYSGGYSGTFAETPDVTVTAAMFSSHDAALDYLEEHAEKWENALAVTVNIEGGIPYTLIGAWCSS